MTISRCDEVWWAKEVVLVVIDDEISRLNMNTVVSLEMLTELLSQRNRVARMFRLPERTLYPRCEGATT